jgi:hypothetical protein
MRKKLKTKILFSFFQIESFHAITQKYKQQLISTWKSCQRSTFWSENQLREEEIEWLRMKIMGALNEISC